MSTEPHAEHGTMPPMKPSEESTQDQLRLAREQGDAYARAMEAMRRETGRLASTRARDYEIAVTAEHPEGMYMLQDGRLTWQNPTDENIHIEVAVRDAADGRFVPGLPVVVTVLTADSREVGTQQHEFLWHPWLYHYGRNWHVPGDGTYRIRVHIDPPTFARHDHENGRRYGQPVDVELSLDFKTGQKLA